MSIWLAIPSARPAAEVDATMDHWRKQGYQIALFLDSGSTQVEGWPPKPVQLIYGDYQKPKADLCILGLYQGYAKACNLLVKYLIEHDPTAQWFVCAGDDTLPDPSKSAQQIAEQCTRHFGGTFGVVQNTGDRWGETERWARERFPNAPAYIDRICGSPWLGREFCRRAHGGAGPFHPGFFHMHGDESLQEYAKMLGCFQQRRDLTHYHQHWGRTGDASKMPDFLKGVNTPEHWAESKALLDQLKAERFASCLPID